MSKDSVGASDSVGISLERSPKAVAPKVYCPKCKSASFPTQDGLRACANPDCNHIFTPGN